MDTPAHPAWWPNGANAHSATRAPKSARCWPAVALHGRRRLHVVSGASARGGSDAATLHRGWRLRGLTDTASAVDGEAAAWPTGFEYVEASTRRQPVGGEKDKAARGSPEEDQLLRDASSYPTRTWRCVTPCKEGREAR
jgi:hypothetical protein